MAENKTWITFATGSNPSSYTITVTVEPSSSYCDNPMTDTHDVLIYKAYPEYTGAFYFYWAVGEVNSFPVTGDPAVTIIADWLSSATFIPAD